MIGEARLVIRYAIDPPAKRRGELVAERKKLSPAALHKLQQYEREWDDNHQQAKLPLSLSLKCICICIGKRKEEREQRGDGRLILLPYN